MNMKKTFSYIGVLCFALLTMLTACEDDEKSLGTIPTASDAEFTFKPSANPNIINFSSGSSAFLKNWNFGNGTTGNSNAETIAYPDSGTYQVTLTVYTAGGSVTSTQSVYIAQSDPSLLDLPEYNFLSGGIADTDGKTWVMDKDMLGHMGIGPAGGTWPEWYAAPPNAKDGLGMYDDEVTFTLQGMAFNYKTNNNVYVNAGYGGDFPGAVKEPNGNDFIAPYTPPTGQTWKLVKKGATWFLSISNGGFFGYYSGAAPEYEILSISADELHVRSVQGGVPGNVWYQRFIRKGFVREEPEPEPEPEYKIEDIYTNFDGSSNVTFTPNSNGSIATYDNPAPIPINESARVGKYVKAPGQGGAFSNVQIHLPYKMDLRQRHVFKMKVFVPGYNDFAGENGAESWQTYKTLQRMASVKLQDLDKGDQAYTTQTEVKQENLPLNQWVELTFDFSAAADRTDYDAIVIQLGGEGIYTGGIFFIDDFELLPAAE
jgi:PKD repeat protein